MFDIICWYCGQHLGADLNGDEVAQHAADNPTHGTTLRVERSQPAMAGASSGGFQPITPNEQQQAVEAEEHKRRRKGE
jgi:hypothetical protein